MILLQVHQGKPLEDIKHQAKDAYRKGVFHSATLSPLVSFSWTFSSQAKVLCSVPTLFRTGKISYNDYRNGLHIMTTPMEDFPRLPSIGTLCFPDLNWPVSLAVKPKASSPDIFLCVLCISVLPWPRFLGYQVHAHWGGESAFLERFLLFIVYWVLKAFSVHYWMNSHDPLRQKVQNKETEVSDSYRKLLCWEEKPSCSRFVLEPGGWEYVYVRTSKDQLPMRPSGDMRLQSTLSLGKNFFLQNRRQGHRRILEFPV